MKYLLGVTSVAEETSIMSPPVEFFALVYLRWSDVNEGPMLNSPLSFTIP